MTLGPIDSHVVILAGGRGTRLRPYTTSLPKPLVPIGEDTSILEIVLRQLASRGFRSVTLAIGHLGQLIRAYVGDGTQWGIAVDYAEEDEPLGTMGPVVALLDRLPAVFLVMNGDILTDLNYAALLAAHQEWGAPATVATFAREVDIDFGVLEVEGHTVTNFFEKPILPYTVSMGVYALSHEALREYQPGRALGFDQLMRDLLARGTPPASYRFDGYWLDIGRPADYDQANAEFDERRSVLLPPP
jgi:mannose-1-phosphate guanylyltransferase